MGPWDLGRTASGQASWVGPELVLEIRPLLDVLRRPASWRVGPSPSASATSPSLWRHLRWSVGGRRGRRFLCRRHKLCAREAREGNLCATTAP